MMGWKDLGVVETIYEDDHEDYTSSHSPSLSPTSPSPPSPLHDIVKTWSLATGLETDVVIHVQDQTFQLHKDPLISKSGYLKRHLTDSSEITVSPPLTITAETFSSVIDFCYSYQVVITPFNVAALSIAAELLEMTGNVGGDNQNLRQRTENYFCQVVTVNREFAMVVLRSCLPLLPEAEAEITASLVGRCIEALGVIDGFDEVDGWGEEVITVTVEEFQMVVDSMHGRFEQNHDLLYRIVDYYIKEHAGRITEEEKSRLCSSVDCIKLSPSLTMHAVQNPRMPLRFIVRAMLVEQLNTRHSIISTINASTKTATKQSNNSNHQEKKPMTLGAILQRDAALRHAAQLKASMEATCSKIESLEKDLMGMKKLLRKTEKKSASFRLSSEAKISKEDRGWGSFRYRREKVSSTGGEEYSPSSSERSATNEKSLGWRLLNGLKTAFRMSSKQDCSQNMVPGNVDRDLDGEGIGLEEEEVYHHKRSRSFV